MRTNKTDYNLLVSQGILNELDRTAAPDSSGIGFSSSKKLRNIDAIYQELIDLRSSNRLLEKRIKLLEK